MALVGNLVHGNQGRDSLSTSPILFFFILHKAICKGLDELHQLAMVRLNNGQQNIDMIIKVLYEKYQFLALIYEHHLNAKNEVIFAALDSRLKNLVQPYLLQQKGEKDLFDQLLRLLSNFNKTMQNETSFQRELVSLTGVLQMLITKNMAKEEKQVFALLCENFTLEEQASLVWQFLCSLPTYVLSKALSWVSASLSTCEYQALFNCLVKIVPEEKLLQQAIFNWIERKDSRDTELNGPMEKENFEIQHTGSHPIDDILLWHKAINRDLNETFEKIKRMYLSGNFTNRSVCEERVRFIAEVCIFHSIAKDKVIFPAVYSEISFFHQHVEAESKFNEFWTLIQSSRTVSYTPSEFHLKLFSCADQIMETINRQFYIEEVQVLPLARENFNVKKQRELLHRSLCMMPLKLINHVLPWLIGTMNDEEAKRFLDNFQLAVPASDTGLETNNGFSTEQPIDVLFKVHKAVRRDSEYLSIESGRVRNGDEAFLHQFIGRFCLLWGLYRVHSKSEDNIIHPALESREALRNVTHSYKLDHEQEERIFEDISSVLSQLSQIHGSSKIVPIAKNSSTSTLEFSAFRESECVTKFSELSTKLQVMCKSIRVIVDQHMSREEYELWPLFGIHFSVEEQNKIVGFVLGTTGAEELQLLLPWVTSALAQDEKDKMMNTLKHVTRNTMFNNWLSECWEGDSVSLLEAYVSETNIPPKGFLGGMGKSDQMFRPHDIKRVYPHSTSDHKRRADRLRNYMASHWMAAQQRLPQVGENLKGKLLSFRDLEGDVFGCEHYKRNCKLQAACCGKLFTCSFCHDRMSDHSMDREATTEMMCMRCLNIQPLGPKCKTPSCNGFAMAKYYCSICKLFEDERNVYHCPFCNICRIGKGLGVDYFHCMTCNCCLSIRLLSHECKKNCLETSCPLCNEFLFTSTTPVRALPCGHYVHSTCFGECASSPYRCLICKETSEDTMNPQSQKRFLQPKLQKASAESSITVGFDGEMKMYNHDEIGTVETSSWTNENSWKRAFSFARFWAKRLYSFMLWFGLGRVQRIGNGIQKVVEGDKAKDTFLLCCIVMCSLVVLCVMGSLVILLSLKLVRGDKYIFPW
ncbi:Uncharacterized RING finger protein [Morus notabilis]|uniref:Uncharacterized RING finger protein n=1 Tax=Morus notabilis TaxID=981085 RepID=W9ST91_9ROSA|nr:Uncharacterized RING finger protein [Morus notabilis]